MATVSEAVQTAIGHHQAGRLGEAEQIYREVLRVEPRHPDALHLLGLVAHQVGQNDTAIEYLCQAVQIAPNAAAFHDNLAAVYLAVGRLDEAMTSCRQALAVEPDYAEARFRQGNVLKAQGELDKAAVIYKEFLQHHPKHIGAQNNLGLILAAQGHFEEAENYCQRALAVQPDSAETLNNLAGALKGQGRADEAVQQYRRAIALRPDFARAHNNLGSLLAERQEYDEALASYQRALQFQPEDAQTHFNLAVTLRALGKLDEAVSGYERAIELHPEYVEAHHNLGGVLEAQGKVEEAVICYRRALEIRPDSTETLCTLAGALRTQRKPEEAVSNYRQALAIDADFALAHYELGNALREQGQVDAAAASYRRFLRLRPNEPMVELILHSLYPAVFSGRQEMNHRRDEFRAFVERFRRDHPRMDVSEIINYGGEPPFNLQFDSGDVRPIKEAYAAVFRNTFPQETAPGSGGLPRVGIVVTQGHEGTFLRSMEGILRHVDPQCMEVVVICDPGRAAPIRQAIRNEAIQTMPIVGSLEEIADSLRQRRFDLLYYREVGTDALNYFLPFYRLAPVQCTSFGVQVTSGIPTMDCYLSSRFVEADNAADHYRERLVLSETLCPYRYRILLPQQPRPREYFGLGSDQHVYLCAQHLGKFHPDFDPVVAAVLERDERGLLVVVEDRHGHNARALRERFSRTMPDVAERILFLPQQADAEYTSLVAAADVLLDPLYFGGVNTTYDGFSLGKAIVTLPSAFHRGRYTLGCYRKMGLDDGVAADVEDYIRIALRLGTDAEYRRSVEQKIRSASHVLFEDLQTVREHERIFSEWIEASRSRSVSR